MLGKTHAAVGGLTAVGTVFVVNPQIFNPSVAFSGGILSASSLQEFSYIAVFVGSSIVGSLFPDVDIRNSKASIPVISWIIEKTLGHRNKVTHSLIGMMIFSLLILIGLFVLSPLLASFAFLGFAMGFGTHLYLDKLTVSGVPLYHGFKPNKIEVDGVEQDNPAIESRGVLKSGEDDYKVALTFICLLVIVVFFRISLLYIQSLY